MKNFDSSFSERQLAVFRRCIGKTLISIDTDQMTFFHNRSFGEDFNFYSPVILHFGGDDYLLLEGGEDRKGDRVLSVNKQNTPSPLNFAFNEYGNHEKEDVSGIMVLKTIKNVTLYAFGDAPSEGTEELDTAVVFDLEDNSCLCFVPAAYGTGLCVNDVLIAQKLEHSYARWSAK
ncbi:hypothetical protein CR205_06165 [Alteribacter lacisalsi]|uniref:Uncharacterized protein n=1 Tax=Alteribacter lacisalsi TaxID=2045244 RepID=A0A2W0HAJ3_9BACI|nr:hypothetical protein [Alteribacter lacisalsi]PYZ98177.1 hypothetical protein CR205_06165 [Alteribacter lacisalsi]